MYSLPTGDDFYYGDVEDYEQHLIDKLMGKAKSERLEEEAKREAVKVHGGGQFGMDEIAELPQPLYCFTKEELNEYKEAILKEERNG